MVKKVGPRLLERVPIAICRITQPRANTFDPPEEVAISQVHVSLLWKQMRQALRFYVCSAKALAIMGVPNSPTKLGGASAFHNCESL